MRLAGCYKKWLFLPWETKHRELLGRRYECVGVKWNFCCSLCNAKQMFRVISEQSKAYWACDGKVLVSKVTAETLPKFTCPELYTLFYRPVIFQLYNLRAALICLKISVYPRSHKNFHLPQILSTELEFMESKFYYWKSCKTQLCPSTQSKHTTNYFLYCMQKSGLFKGKRKNSTDFQWDLA